MIQENTRLLIVGLDLADGSYAMGLKKGGYHVDTIEIDQLSINYVIKHNIINCGSTFDIDYIKKADIIISRLYPNMTIDWITTYQKYFRPDTLITNVSSVKTGVVESIQKIIRRDVGFVSSHLMAGKEANGVKSADGSIFHIASSIIPPTEDNTKKAVATMRQLIKTLGFSNISELTTAQHDEMIGFVSHLIHAITVSLMNANDNTHLVEYTGNSFCDLARIAKINENLWSEVFSPNRENLIRGIDDFIQEASRLEAAPEQGDVDGLKELFIQSTAGHKLFD